MIWIYALWDFDGDDILGEGINELKRLLNLITRNGNSMYVQFDSLILLHNAVCHIAIFAMLFETLNDVMN